MKFEEGICAVENIKTVDLLLLAAILALVLLGLFIFIVQVAKWAVRETHPRPTPQPVAKPKKWPPVQYTYDAPSERSGDFKIVYTGRGTIDGMPMYIGIASPSGAPIRYRHDPPRRYPSSEE